MKPLRIVLFGMPDSGKSSLLAALVQAEHEQEESFNGKLNDLSGGLTQLHNQLYKNQPANSPNEEVTAYPVEFVPILEGEQTIPAVLYDCDGRQANYLVRGGSSKSLVELGKQSELPRAVLNADTVLLIIDRSADNKEIEAACNQFCAFLHKLEVGRSQSNATNGLPVYLVLTKCDLLAKPDVNTLTKWQEYLMSEEQRFQHYFNKSREKYKQKNASFGEIKLDVWTTAVWRPKYARKNSDPPLPYHVGELFRHCLNSALEYRKQERLAQRKLNMTLGVMAVLALLMISLGSWFFVTGTSGTPLDTRISQYMKEVEESPASLYAKVPRELEQIKTWKNNESYRLVKQENKDSVEDIFAKLKAYEKFSQQVDQLPPPKYSSNLEELNLRHEKILNVKPPTKYADEWANHSNAGKRREEWLTEANHLRKEVTKAEKFYKDLTASWDDLQKKFKAGDITFPVFKQEKNKLVNQSKTYPYRDEKKNEDLPSVPGKRLRVYDVIKFHEVQQAYDTWKNRKMAEL